MRLAFHLHFQQSRLHDHQFLIGVAMRLMGDTFRVQPGHMRFEPGKRTGGSIDERKAITGSSGYGARMVDGASYNFV